MPEGNVVAKETDFLRSYLVDHDSQWLHLSCVKKYGHAKRYANVDLKEVIPAIGHRIIDIRCKGKKFFILLANNITLEIHHGMNGRWSITRDAHTQFELHFTREHPTEAKEHRAIYCINTRFGKFKILKSENEFKEAWNNLAPGFIGTDLITLNVWSDRLSRFHEDTTIQSLLMDQKLLCSGVGNFLFAEIMWYARLRPNSKLRDLTNDKKVELFHICKRTVIGHYDGSLEKVIYKKEKSPTGHQIVPMDLGGRTVYWVPTEQF